MFGVEGGITAATLHLSGGGSASWTPGFLVGLFYTPKPDAMTWQIEGMLHRKGAGIGAGTLRVTEVEVPVLVRVNLRPDRRTGVHLLAGPVVGFQLRTTVRTGVEDETLDLTDNVRRIEIGAVIGAGVDVGRVTVGARLFQGLAATRLIVDNRATRTRVIALLLGFRL